MLGTGIGADPEVSRPGDPGKIILWLFFREVFFKQFCNISRRNKERPVVCIQYLQVTSLRCCVVSIKCDLFQGHVQEPIQESLPQEIQVILTTLSSKKNVHGIFCFNHWQWHRETKSMFGCISLLPVAYDKLLVLCTQVSGNEVALLISL